jgi:hypothetical protein
MSPIRIEASSNPSDVMRGIDDPTSIRRWPAAAVDQSAERRSSGALSGLAGSGIASDRTGSNPLLSTRGVST